MRLSVLREEFPATGTHLDSIDAALDRIEDLNEKLLTVAKTGRTDPERTTLDLADCVERAWSTLDADDATLELTVAEGDTVSADHNQIHQLFESLLENAVEHGGETVSVEVGSLPDGFYIADDGAGIPEQKREAVFRMGYSTHTNGNGLGLNIAAEIADAHDWELSVSASEDGGARFEITGV
jgi:signal transduction histidine kinase